MSPLQGLQNTVYQYGSASALPYYMPSLQDLHALLTIQERTSVSQRLCVQKMNINEHETNIKILVLDAWLLYCSHAYKSIVINCWTCNLCRRAYSRFILSHFVCVCRKYYVVSTKEQEMEDADIGDMVGCKSCFIGTGNMLDSYDKRWNDRLDDTYSLYR